MSLATERRAARERALGLLYEAEAKGVDGVDVLASLPVAPDDFAASLVRAVHEHREQIDALLERFSKDWTLARMPALDRAALRMGSAELIARLDVPTGVVLAETVELASRFSTDGSGRFVNGLLARVAQEVRPHPSQPAADDGRDDVVPPQVDALVIDLDGVIRHWDEGYLAEAEARLGLPSGAIGAAALEPGRLARATDGRLTFEGWCAELAAEIAATYGTDPAEAAAAWADSAWRIDLTVMELVDAVRSVVPVALLSNASTSLRADLERSGILDSFDVVVCSAEIGAAKPAAAAFQAALDGLGVVAERALFVDDLDVNVEGARAAGMRAERFVGVDELRELLAGLGILR